MRPHRRDLLLGAAALGVGACAPGRGGGAAAGPTPAALDLADLEARHGGRLGVLAQDPGGAAGWRADERFLYCSTFKLFLAAAHLEAEQRQPGSLGREALVRQEDLVFHAPVTGALVGQTVDLARLCQAAVEVSDNTAANLLVRELGGLDAWRAWYRGLGDAVTRVDRWETALNLPDGDLDTTTPAQSVANLGRLFLGPEPRLDAASRQRLTGWLMASPTAASRIRSGLPAGWRGATKTGTSGLGHANDIGLALPPGGDPVRIAVYYAGMEDTPPDQRDAVIAEAARRALGALGHG